ncbi:hypothetical protein MRX96_031006 [Rhipicephalus microplus]
MGRPTLYWSPLYARGKFHDNTRAFLRDHRFKLSFAPQDLSRFNDTGDLTVSPKDGVTVTTFPHVQALGQSRWQPLPSGRRLCRQQCCAEARAARDAWRRSLNTQRQRIRRLDDAYRIAERARNAQLQRRLRNALERDRLQFGSIEELTWLRDCFDKEEWAFLESLWPKPTRSVGRPRSGWLRTPLITGHPPSDDEKPSLLLLSVPNAVPRASSTVTLEDLLSGALPLRVPPEGGSQVAGDE